MTVTMISIRNYILLLLLISCSSALAVCNYSVMPTRFFIPSSEVSKDLFIKNHSSAKNDLGLIFEKEGDIKKAKELCQEAAKLGNSDAMTNLGFVFEKEGDIKKAKKLYQEAAKLGNAKAMSNLGGIFYQEGDIKKAKELYQEAAKLGNAQAMGNLGSIFGIAK